MKIAFVSQPWTLAAPAQPGDSLGIWTSRVAERLVPHHEVLVYGITRELWRTQEQVHEGIRYRGVPVGVSRLGVHKVLTLFHAGARRSPVLRPRLPFFASRWFHWEYAWRVAWDLRSQHCDVIHVQNFSQFVPVIRALNPTAKIVLHMHCEWLTQVPPDLLRSRLVQADLILGCSDYITQKIQARFPELAARCQTVVNGVDLEAFRETKLRTKPALQRPNTPPTILYVGRISPEKGLHVLIEAFVQVAKKYTAARLKLVGPELIADKEFIVDLSDDPNVLDLARFYPGSYLMKLQQLIPAALMSRVEFTGAIAHDLLPQMYRSAALVVNPSLSEAFGMSLVEGMAAGIPVVASAVGGMTSVVVDGQTGRLVPANNAFALARALEDLLANPTLRQSLGYAGQQRAQDLFSWTQVTHSLLRHYQSLDQDGQDAIAPTVPPTSVPRLAKASVTGNSHS